MISVKDLHKSFHNAAGDVEVLKGISTEIKDGEKVVIIGPSGSGKSTFLRCMNLLEEPTSGSIEFDEQPIAGPDAKNVSIDRIRAQMGMVFQQFNLFPHMTVEENITMAPVMIRKQNKSDAIARAHELLKMVGLEEKAGAYPRQLSGGQQQRVAIVRALAMDPKMMLFDEPTSALDPEMVGEVLRVMEALADKGMTMAVVTHEMNFARHVANRILFVDDGQILEENTPDAFFDNPQNPRAQDFLSKIINT